jgi:hypothetical protein
MISLLTLQVTLAPPSLQPVKFSETDSTVFSWAFNTTPEPEDVIDEPEEPKDPCARVVYYLRAACNNTEAWCRSLRDLY